MHNSQKLGRIKRASILGFSVLEVAIASTFLSVVIVGGAALQSTLYKTTRENNERTFATEKVYQMFEEMRAYTEGNREKAQNSLVDFSDGVYFNPVLTTDRNANKPDDTLSKNVWQTDHWKYVRKVQIEPLENDDFARRVTVTIWYAGADGKPMSETKPLASITGILKTTAPRTPPTQVYDFYVISIANAPSWWSDLFDFRPAYDAVFSDLEFRNPGLKLRKQYISNLAYGRDPFYLPHINTEHITESPDLRLPWAYYYPGKIKVTQNNANKDKLKEDFVFKNFTGRVRGDRAAEQFTLRDKGASDMFRPFAMADEHNHGMRWPQQSATEKRLNAQGYAITDDAIKSNPELGRLRDALLAPTLVSFLEGMNQGRYRNSMLSNMHAELTPLPPIRNYSDAAKVPYDERAASNSAPAAEIERHRYMRLVSHPEKIFSANDESQINWRVYGYEMPRFGSFNALDSAPQNSPEARIQRVIQHSTVFVPFDGDGRHPTSTTRPGYLSNPDYNVPSNITPPIDVEKIIGNERVQYRWRQMLRTSDSDYSLTKETNLRNAYLLMADRDTLINTPPAGFSGTAAEYNAGVQQLGQLQSISYDGQWLAFAPAAPIAAQVAQPNPLNQNNVSGSWSTAQDVHRNLIGDFVLLNSQKPTIDSPNPTGFQMRQVLQTVRCNANCTNTATGEVTAPGIAAATWPNGTVPGQNWILVRLNAPVDNTDGVTNNIRNLLTSTNAVVTRHRDYEVEVNPTVQYGETRKGVLVHLYNTPTRHRLHSASNTGLPSSRLLYGHEYIPAPVSDNRTPNDISDDFLNDLTNNLSRANLYESTSVPAAHTSSYDPANRARNTARWRVSLRTDGALAGAIEDKTLTLETRIMGGQNSYSLRGANAYLQDGINADGDTHMPDNPASAPNENNITLRSNMYNVSHTYVYRGVNFDRAVPKTEQFQYIGDPRHMPYADVKLRHGYNTAFYRNSSAQTSLSNDTGNSDNHAGYQGYARHDGQYSGHNKIDVDVAKAFSLYVEGILESNSVYNTIAGYTNYIISLGGGIGQRGDHTYRYNIRTAPWIRSGAPSYTDNGEGNGTTSERGSSGHLRFITAATADDNAQELSSWSGFSHLGEMFPDEFYQFWQANGNLPTVDYNAANHNLGDAAATAIAANNLNNRATRFYRAKYVDTPFRLAQRERITAEGAINDFYNGGANPANDDDRIQHSTNEGEGCLEAGPGEAGRYLSDAFNVSLPESIDSTRSFCIASQTVCTAPVGVKSSEYIQAEQMLRRNTVKYLNITGPAQGQTTDTPSKHTAFYRYHSGNCGNAVSKNVASGLIKITREAFGSTSANANLVGYAVINGLEQGSLFGAQSLSRLAQAATLQGFMEGGDRNIPGNSAGRIVPLPRVEIIDPDPNKIWSGSSIGVKFNVKWSRWDDRKYSPSYPNGWYDSTPIQFNAMYSEDNGRNWKYVNSNTPVLPEMLAKYNPDERIEDFLDAYTMTSPTQNWEFPWDISGFSSGTYLLRVNTNRESFDQGLSYHEMFITIKKD